MMDAWYTRHPQWFASELDSLCRTYPKFVLDEGSLHRGEVVVYGELLVRPVGGTKRHAVRIVFPSNSPYAFPSVAPIEKMPTFDAQGAAISHLKAEMFDHRHQMPGGALCLFQYETRVEEGGESIRVVDVLKRAEAWFLGLASGHWPPDSRESELQAHFYRANAGILLSKTFYSDRLRGHGEFFAVRDMHRFYVGKSQEKPPLIATAATVLTGVYEVIDARNDLVNIFPWIANDAWEPKAFVESQEKQRQQKGIDFGDLAKVSGWWWELDSEPSIFRDGKGLLQILSAVAPNEDAWAMVSKAMGADLTIKNTHHVSLCYPSRAGQREWLFLVVMTGGNEVAGAPTILSEEQKRERFERATVACTPVQAMTDQEITLRNSTVISHEISQKRVALLGVGALGSKVAELLAQAGVTKFTLCDGDAMSVGNVARHIGGMSDFGSAKTKVAANRIWEINPYAEIAIVNGYLSLEPDATQDFCSDADLVVSTIADEGVETGFNDQTVLLGVPVVYGRALRRGEMGRIFLVRPKIDACKTCLSLIAREGGSQWIKVTERPEDVLLHECGRPVIAGSAIDLSFTASLIARQALDYLEGNTRANHLVWSLRGSNEFGERLRSPFSVATDTFSPISNCPSCTPAVIQTVELSDDIRRFITDEVNGSPTSETGGILIGRITDSTATVKIATGPGPNAVRTANRFERDVEYAQKQLELAMSRDTSLAYIGEWHSHLVATPEPSGRDVLSMTGIAGSSNYATDCPTMLICGFDTAKNEIGELKAWVFPVASCMRQVSIVQRTVA